MEPEAKPRFVKPPYFSCLYDMRKNVASALTGQDNLSDETDQTES